MSNNLKNSFEEESILFITLDSCRFDTFLKCLNQGKLTNLSAIGPLHKAKSPSYFTYGSHASFWMGFTPGVQGVNEPWLNPKASKLFRMAHAGHPGINNQGFTLEGSNIIEGFRRQGYRCIGTGAVDWFNPANETGSILGSPFDSFYFAGNTWSLMSQLSWIESQIKDIPLDQPIFLFLNIGETHVPYWHEGASWDRWPSPCIPFGGPSCSFKESARRQEACLIWVDNKLEYLLKRFKKGTILACADHGDCWGEDGLWEHGISHDATLTVPLLLRVSGKPIGNELNPSSTNPSRFHNVFARLQRFWTTRL